MFPPLLACSLHVMMRTAALRNLFWTVSLMLDGSAHRLSVATRSTSLANAFFFVSLSFLKSEMQRDASSLDTSSCFVWKSKWMVNMVSISGQYALSMTKCVSNRVNARQALLAIVMQNTRITTEGLKLYAWQSIWKILRCNIQLSS